MAGVQLTAVVFARLELGRKRESVGGGASAEPYFKGMK